MTQRMNLRKTHRLGMAAVLGLEAYSRTHVPGGLYELIQLRASILNQCAYCIDMHMKSLVKRGETAQRIEALHERDLSPDLYEPRELAALRLTDAETVLATSSFSLLPLLSAVASWALVGTHINAGLLVGAVVIAAGIALFARAEATSAAAGPPLR